MHKYLQPLLKAAWSAAPAWGQGHSGAGFFIKHSHCCTRLFLLNNNHPVCFVLWHALFLSKSHGINWSCQGWTLIKGQKHNFPAVEHKRNSPQVVWISSVFKISLTLFSEYSRDFTYSFRVTIVWPALAFTLKCWFEWSLRLVLSAWKFYARALLLWCWAPAIEARVCVWLRLLNPVISVSICI